MLALRVAVLAAVTVAMSLGAAMPARADASSTVGLSDTRLLVGFRAGASADERLHAVQSVGGYVDAEIPQLGVTRIVVPVSDALGASADPLDVISGHSAVEWAEADRTVRLTFTPDDEYYRSHPVADDGQWGIRKALVDKAWDTTRGDGSVIVAILDTGIDPTHPDLEDALTGGTTFISSPDDECTPGTERDDNSHGTHVAGIVGARGNNGEGIAGVAFGVRVMAVKVLDCTGQGNLSDVASGLTWAVDNGARIVNISLGSMSDSSTLRRAVTYAADHDVLVVAASGNCGTSAEKCLSLNQVEYPAAYASVLAVGATDRDDTIAFFSTRNDSVDVSAPGRRILSTTPTYATFLSQRATDPASLEYAVFSGTSQASPFVAGLAALIWSAEPGLTADEVAERIRSTADDLGRDGRDDSFGDGRVNALKAVSPGGDVYGATYDLSTLPTAAAPARAFQISVVATNTSTFTWRRTGTSAVHLEWSWLDASGVAVDGLRGEFALPIDVAVGRRVTIAGPVVTPARAGAYTLRLDLVRVGGVAFSARGVAPADVPVRIGSGVDAAYEPPAGATAFEAGARGSVQVVVRNTGTVAWPASGETPVRLSYHWLQGETVVTWEGERMALPADVAPGASVTVALAVLPPLRAGTYTLRIDLVQEGVGWFSELGIAPLDIAASVTAGYVATYEVTDPSILLPGGRAFIPVSVTNTGTATWAASDANPVRLATHLVDASGAVVVWDGVRTDVAGLQPGKTLATTVVVDAPATPGSYRVRVDAVREGIAWFSGLGVATGDTDLLVVADYRAELPTGPLTVSAAEPTVEVTVRNIGVATWTVSTVSPLAVAAHWYDADGNVLVWDGPRTFLTEALPTGGIVTLTVDLGTPPAGAAAVTIDLVSEGLRWFGAGLRRPVTLGP